MKTKILELRDAATFIPVLAVEMTPTEPAENYLLGRAGYGIYRCILLARADGGGKAEYDAFSWGDRTFNAAHQFINLNWDSLRSGDVIDVEFILGETTVKKISERYNNGYGFNPE